LNIFTQGFKEATRGEVLDCGFEGSYPWEYKTLDGMIDYRCDWDYNGLTDSGLCKIGWRGDPGEVVAEFCERVGEALDVACAVVEEIEAHI
jgi:hypothetical protein